MKSRVDLTYLFRKKRLLPFSLLIIRQHADDRPLCENNSVPNAQQIVIAMEIQRCWSKSLANLGGVPWVEGGDGDGHPVLGALCSRALSLDEAVQVPSISAGNGLQVECLLPV